MQETTEGSKGSPLNGHGGCCCWGTFLLVVVVSSCLFFFVAVEQKHISCIMYQDQPLSVHPQEFSQKVMPASLLSKEVAMPASRTVTWFSDME